MLALLLSKICFAFAIPDAHSENLAPSVVTISQTKKYISCDEKSPCHYVESIYNKAKNKPAFVTIRVLKINNPGGDNEELEELDFSEESEIYVMPNQVVIPANGMRSVRIYVTGQISRNRDQYFRIRFSPTPLEHEAPDGDKQSQSSSALFLGFGIGQLLLVARTDPAYNSSILIDKEDKSPVLKVSNLGNSFIRLERLRICYSKESGMPCQYLSSKHVRTKAHKTFPLEEHVRSIEFSLEEGRNHQKVSYEKDRKTPLTIN
ncbi:hypothetical protein ACWJJH_06300 [Endozoicomonadaceae bacterium StTr2]